MQMEDLKTIATAIARTQAQRHGKGGKGALNLSINYVRSWSPANGVRELVSNLVDGAHCLVRAMASAAHGFTNRVELEVVAPPAAESNERIIRFYARRSGGADDNTLLVASISIRREHSNTSASTCSTSNTSNGSMSNCVLKLVNYFTRLDHEQVLAMGGTTKTNNDDNTTIGTHGEGVKLAALAILRGDNRHVHAASVAFYTAAKKWSFVVREGRLAVDVRALTSVKPRDAQDAPSLHTTVVVRWQSCDDVAGSLEYMLPLYRLYAPLLPAAVLSAPLLRFGGHDVVDCEAFIALLPDDGCLLAGSVFVSHMFVQSDADGLPFAIFSDARLKGELSRDRNRLEVGMIGRHLARRLAVAIRSGLIDKRVANALFHIVAFRLIAIERKKDATGDPTFTVWDCLLNNDCRRWFAEQFRLRHARCYPCADDKDVSAVRDRLGLTPLRVSRCLFAMLTKRPAVTGFWPIDRAAELTVLEAPIVGNNDSDPLLVHALVALVNKALRLCACVAHVDNVIVHDASTPTFVLEESRLHCPASLFRPPATRASVLRAAFAALMSMPQIAPREPWLFYDSLLSYMANIEKGVVESPLSLVQLEASRKRLFGDEHLEIKRARCASTSAHDQRALHLTDRLVPLRRPHEECVEARRDTIEPTLVRIASLPLEAPPIDETIVAYYHEDTTVPRVPIDWTAMWWCARVARALLGDVFLQPERAFVVAWAPTASYRATNRNPDHLLVFNAAHLYCRTDGALASSLRLFVTVSHELTHDEHRSHGPVFLAAFQSRIATHIPALYETLCSRMKSETVAF